MTEHRRRRMPNWLPAVAAVLAIVAGGVWFMIGNQQEATRADAAEGEAVDKATTLDQLCATDPDVARRIPEDCREAREIREQVVLPASSPGPSQAQVQGWVEDWLDAHPARNGRSVTPQMVARAVAEHMAGNGQDQIARVAQAYLAANAERFRGERGEAGVDGQNATDDQVAAAVAAFCAEHGQCQGPQGDAGVQGPQGWGVRDIRPERNGDGVCEWVVVFEDPVSSEQRVARHPAGDAACPASPPPDAGGLLPGS